MTETKVTDFRQEVLAKIVSLVTGVWFDTNPTSITEDSTFVSLGMDSLDMVELSMELEDSFHVDFKGVEISWVTLKDSIDSVIAKKVTEQNV